jgi:hypothetical protein
MINNICLKTVLISLIFRPLPLTSARPHRTTQGRQQPDSEKHAIWGNSSWQATLILLVLDLPKARIWTYQLRLPFLQIKVQNLNSKNSIRYYQSPKNYGDESRKQQPQECRPWHQWAGKKPVKNQSICNWKKKSKWSTTSKSQNWRKHESMCTWLLELGASCTGQLEGDVACYPGWLAIKDAGDNRRSALENWSYRRCSITGKLKRRIRALTWTSPI